MKYLFFLIFFLPHVSLAQLVTDSTVAMIAYWELGEKVSYEFTSKEIKIRDGKRKSKSEFYDIEMTVLDSTENNFEVEWAYLNSRADYEMDAFEKQIMEQNERLPTIIRTDEVGSFETISNWKEMQIACDSLMTDWLDKQFFPDTVKTNLRKTFSAMFANEAQVNFWATEIRTFLSPYGYVYDRLNPLEGVKYYTNAFIGKQMPGTEKFTVLDVDEDTGIAKIEMLAGIKDEQVKVLMLDYIRQNLEEFGLQPTDKPTLEDMPFFDVSEKIICSYHIYSGYILDLTYNKKVKADFNTTIKILTFKLNLD